MPERFVRASTRNSFVARLLVGGCALAGILLVFASDRHAPIAEAQHVTTECPHQGRDPTTVHVPPEVSTLYAVCGGATGLSSGPVQGYTVSSAYCPYWMQTGLSYNPAIAKVGVRITHSEEVEEYTVFYKCTSPSWLRRIFSSGPECVESSRTVCQIQLNVLAEGLCAQFTEVS